MGTLNYSNLWILRHGAYEMDALTDRGKAQIRIATEIMFNQGLGQEEYPIIMCSPARRASESAFVIEDEARKAGKRITTMHLQYLDILNAGGTSEKKLEKIIEFANSNKWAQDLLIVTHQEVAELLPELILRRDFGNSKEYFFNKGEGAYINLSNGQLTEIRQPQ